MTWKDHVLSGVDAFEDSFRDPGPGDRVPPSPKRNADDRARGDARASGRNAHTPPSRHARGKHGDDDAGPRTGDGKGGDRDRDHDRDRDRVQPRKKHTKSNNRHHGYDSPPKAGSSDRSQASPRSPTSPERKLCFYVGSESSKLPNGFRCGSGTDGCDSKTTYKTDATGCDPSVYKYKCFTGMQFETQSQRVTNGVLTATDKTHCPVWHVDG